MMGLENACKVKLQLKGYDISAIVKTDINFMAFCKYDYDGKSKCCLHSNFNEVKSYS